MIQATTFTAAVVALSGALAGVKAQTTIPLAEKEFTYPNLPYRVDTDDGPRGHQQGYNLCNSTTEGQTSMCQTAFVNSLEDFCLWAPPEPNSIVGNTEGEMVAWCTQPGRGTRLIPEGALTGVQFMKTRSYLQVVGFVNQNLINIGPEDYGGEMDPHGADRRGNPLGGLVFSNGFGPAGSNGTWTQVREWHNFMGANMFCIKACDPADDDDRHYCEHIYDRIGCTYNAPADYSAINGTFTSCEGENQLFPGVYVENGQTRTFTQPPEEDGVISTMPYQPSIPASSQCSTYTSASIYTGLAAAPAASTTSAASEVSSAASSGASSVASAASSGATGVRGAAAGTSSRASAAAASATTSNTGGAAQNAAGLSALLIAGVAGAFALLA